MRTLREFGRRRTQKCARSKDWYVHAPPPDPKLVDWLRTSRREWAPKLSISRNAPCEHCGAPTSIVRLEGRRRRAWCSAGCAQAWHNRRRPKVQHVEKACSECGLPFIPARTDAAYCSSACRQTAYRSRHAEFSASRNTHLPEVEAEARKRQATSAGGADPQLFPPMGEAGKGKHSTATDKAAAIVGVCGSSVQQAKAVRHRDRAPLELVTMFERNRRLAPIWGRA